MIELVFPGLAWLDAGGILCLDICAFLVLACFFISVATDNYSQVDKLWSITPWMYVWVLAFVDRMQTPRLVWMAVVAFVWGARLTLNFNRRGGYTWPKFWLGEVS